MTQELIMDDIEIPEYDLEPQYCLHLTFFRDGKDELEKSYKLKNWRNVIGRASDADCQTPERYNQISGKHAVIEYRKGEYFLEDLGSRNHTFLKSQRRMPEEKKISKRQMVPLKWYMIFPGDLFFLANVKGEILHLSDERVSFSEESEKIVKSSESLRTAGKKKSSTDNIPNPPKRGIIEDEDILNDKSESDDEKTDPEDSESDNENENGDINSLLKIPNIQQSEENTIPDDFEATQIPGFFGASRKSGSDFSDPFGLVRKSQKLINLDEDSEILASSLSRSKKKKGKKIIEFDYEATQILGGAYNKGFDLLDLSSSKSEKSENENKTNEDDDDDLTTDEDESDNEKISKIKKLGKKISDSASSIGSASDNEEDVIIAPPPESTVTENDENKKNESENKLDVIEVSQISIMSRGLDSDDDSETPSETEIPEIPELPRKKEPEKEEIEEEEDVIISEPSKNKNSEISKIPEPPVSEIIPPPPIPPIEEDENEVKTNEEKEENNEEDEKEPVIFENSGDENNNVNIVQPPPAPPTVENVVIPKPRNIKIIEEEEEEEEEPVVEIPEIPKIEAPEAEVQSFEEVEEVELINDSLIGKKRDRLTEEDEEEKKRISKKRKLPESNIDNEMKDETEVIEVEDDDEGDEKLPVVCFTGISDNLRKRQVKILEDLGGRASEDVDEISHLVVDKIRRTMKFLNVVGYNHVKICSPAWLNQSKRFKKFADEERFLLKDKKGERQFKMTLQNLFEKRRSNITANGVRKVFSGKIFFITKRCKPKPEQLKELVESNGGIARSGEVEIGNVDEIDFIISCGGDRLEIMKNRELYGKIEGKVLNKEFVLMSILRQSLDIDNADYKKFD